MCTWPAATKAYRDIASLARAADQPPALAPDPLAVFTAVSASESKAASAALEPSRRIQVPTSSTAAMWRQSTDDANRCAPRQTDDHDDWALRPTPGQRSTKAITGVGCGFVAKAIVWWRRRMMRRRLEVWGIFHGARMDRRRLRHDSAAALHVDGGEQSVRVELQHRLSPTSIRD